VLVGPMQREIARLNFEGKLQAVAEPVYFRGGDHGKSTQTLPFETWNAVVSYGESRRGPDTGNPKAEGRAQVAQLGDNQFLVAGYFCRFLIQRQFESHDRGFLYVESHERALCGHFKIRKAELGRNIFRLELACETAETIQIRFQANRARYNQLRHVLKIMIPSCVLN
jgi:hypothetical protein